MKNKCAALYSSKTKSLMRHNSFAKSGFMLKKRFIYWKKKEIKIHPAGEYWFSYYILLKMHFQREMTKSALMHWLYVCAAWEGNEKQSFSVSLLIAWANGSEFTFIFGFVNVFSGMHTSFVWLQMPFRKRVKSEESEYRQQAVNRCVCLLHLACSR